MYEKETGAARLIGVLWRNSENDAVIKTLARALYYDEKQLKQDMVAIWDWYLDKSRDDDG